MAGRATENFPGGSLKYQFVYFKICIFKCGYRMYIELVFSWWITTSLLVDFIIYRGLKWTCWWDYVYITSGFFGNRMIRSNKGTYLHDNTTTTYFRFFFSTNIFLDIRVIKQQFRGNQLNGSTDLTIPDRGLTSNIWGFRHQTFGESWQYVAVT